jgi:rubrerythrin
VSQNTAASHPAFSELFGVLAQEEIVHMKYLDMLKNFQSEAVDLFLETGNSIETATVKLEEIRSKCASIRSRRQEATEKEVIEAAFVIENELMEWHRKDAIRVADESLRKLFQSLEFADAAHLEKLKKYQAERG